MLFVIQLRCSPTGPPAPPVTQRPTDVCPTTMACHVRSGGGSIVQPSLSYTFLNLSGFISLSCASTSISVFESRCVCPVMDWGAAQGVVPGWDNR